MKKQTKKRKIRKLVKRIRMGKTISISDWHFLAKNWMYLSKKFLKETLVIFPWEEALTSPDIPYTVEDFDRVSDLILSYTLKEWEFTEEMYEKYWKHTGVEYLRIKYLYDKTWTKITEHLIESSYLSEDQIEKILDTNFFLYISSVVCRYEGLPSKYLQKYWENYDQYLQLLEKSGNKNTESEITRMVKETLEPYTKFMDTSKFFY